MGEDQEAKVAALLGEYQCHFTSLKTKWTQAFLEVDLSYAIIIKDLKTLHQHNKKLKTALSISDAQAQENHSNLLQGIQQVSENLKTLADSHHSTAGKVKRLQEEHQNLELSSQAYWHVLDLQLQEALQTIQAED